MCFLSIHLQTQCFLAFLSCLFSERSKSGKGRVDWDVSTTGTDSVHPVVPWNTSSWAAAEDPSATWTGQFQQSPCAKTRGCCRLVPGHHASPSGSHRCWRWTRWRQRGDSCYIPVNEACPWSLCVAPTAGTYKLHPPSRSGGEWRPDVKYWMRHSRYCQNIPQVHLWIYSHQTLCLTSSEQPHNPTCIWRENMLFLHIKLRKKHFKCHKITHFSFKVMMTRFCNCKHAALNKYLNSLHV